MLSNIKSCSVGTTEDNLNYVWYNLLHHHLNFPDLLKNGPKLRCLETDNRNQILDICEAHRIQILNN